MRASVLRGMSAMQRGVRGHDRTVRADICTREGSTCPPRRGMYALHLVFLFQLSPKWGMNPLISEGHRSLPAKNILVGQGLRPGAPLFSCMCDDSCCLSVRESGKRPDQLNGVVIRQGREQITHPNASK
jgi:hypothetical protein